MIEVLIPEERNQIIGHRRVTYERYYMPGFIDRDCQAIYLGSPSRDDFVRAVGRLAYNQGAPTALTDVQKLAISNDPQILELGKTRRTCVAKIQDLGYSIIKAAEGTAWYKRHRDVHADINSLKRQLSESRLQQAIREFHNTIDRYDRGEQAVARAYPTDRSTHAIRLLYTNLKSEPRSLKHGI